jgi:hypothetical protein
MNSEHVWPAAEHVHGRSHADEQAQLAQELASLFGRLRSRDVVGNANPHVVGEPRSVAGRRRVMRVSEAVNLAQALDAVCHILGMFGSAPVRFD